MTILEVSGLDELGDDQSHFLARQRFVLLLLQLFDQLHLVFMENEVIKYEVVNRLVHLCKQPLDFFTSNREVLVHHLFKVSSFFDAGVDILGDDVTYLLQSQDIMGAFVFFVKANAALGFADGGLIGAGETAPQLYGISLVDVAQYPPVFGVASKHSRLQTMSIQFKIEEEESPNSIGSSSYQQQRIGKYLMGKTIGEGTFNKVRIARHLYTNEQVAVKMIEKSSVKSESDQMRLKKELNILRKVRHPHIIQLYEILEDKSYYYLVTEYASRGQLFEHIVKHEKLTEFEASKFLQQLLSAIEYLHDIGVVHRDIKPENILLDYKYNVKLVDFGLSDIYSKGERLNTACGSPCYAPPQMLGGKGYEPLKVDIWSLGIVLYAMCFGYLPFDHPDSSELFKIIKAGNYELPEHASEQLRGVLQLILEVDPEKRATIDQIRKHCFCRNNEVPAVLGMIQGLSTIPFEESIACRMEELRLDTTGLQKDIANNKHNDNTATYYLLLQQELRQHNETILQYYLQKQYVINRYKLVEKVKEQYEKRLLHRISTLQQSRRLKLAKSSKPKRGKSETRIKTTDKKYRTGMGDNSKYLSKQLFESPIPGRRRLQTSGHTKGVRWSKKKLKRT